MAALVAEGAKQISETSVRMKAIEETGQNDIRWYDGMALGYPAYLGMVALEIKNFGKLFYLCDRKLMGKQTVRSVRKAAGAALECLPASP
ncbi:MAG: hypothetical protein JXR46_14135 [Calditrichaceae bacterium]|mgnify:CR=1 FL=1|nr:hypothetical protein [Calditrichaceae bacterium]MBN2710177.1 hypothetical protein [Calditrichaceae bacterium]RQV94152.1 MAG: hypothetical protein EH224_10840 [Calditrichota bacterium]